MSNLVKYGSYDMEAAESEQGESERAGGGADFLKLEPGRTVVRILPPPVGRKSPFRVIYQHYYRPPAATGPVVFACPRMETKGQKVCPVCQEGERYKRSGNPADREKAFELFPTRRVFCNAVDRKNPDAGPRVLVFGKMIHEALIALRRDEDAGGDFTHPLYGFDIVIEREGTGKQDTKYRVLPARKQTPLGNEAWLDQQHDLERFAVVRGTEELSAILSGETPPERPRKGDSGKGAPRTSKAPARTAEDDVEDAEYEEQK
jgi:hypothetical protein